MRPMWLHLGHRTSLPLFEFYVSRFSFPTCEQEASLHRRSWFNGDAAQGGFLSGRFFFGCRHHAFFLHLHKRSDTLSRGVRADRIAHVRIEWGGGGAR